jgi:hypothetical protein
MRGAELKRCKQDLEMLLEKALKYDDLCDDPGTATIVARDRIFVNLGLVEDWVKQDAED